MKRLRGPAADLIVGFAHQVGVIADEMTFCGGNAAQLLVTEVAAVRLRATDDLDVIVVAASRTAYDRLRLRLAEKGVVVDTREHAPACRFRTPDGVAVDIMPADGTIMGLETAWFQESMDTAERVTLEATNGATAVISLVAAAAFLALKWSAYADRGNDDPLMSADIEDILTVVAGRPSVVDEMRAASHALRAYVAHSFRMILGHPDLEAAIEDAVPDARRIPSLGQAIRERIAMLAVERRDSTLDER